jgi:hypothetical protein
MGHRPQETAEAAARIVHKRAQVLAQLKQDILADVVGVSRLQPSLAAPEADLPSLALDEFGPSRRVNWLQPQADEQTS